MNTIRLSFTLIAAAALVGSGLLTAPVMSAAAAGTHTTTIAARQAVIEAHGMRAAMTDKKHRLRLITLWELARVRRATAKYQDVDNAIAAGYVDVNLYTPGEGHHYVKESLIDTTFDLTKPEALLYADHGEDGLRLVAVEYLSSDSSPPPEGFTGDADVWQSEPPFPVWMVNAWVWLYNPNGVFAFANPRVP